MLKERKKQNKRITICDKFQNYDIIDLAEGFMGNKKDIIIKSGKDFIFKERHESWVKFVEDDFNFDPNGECSKVVLTVIQSLDNNFSIEDSYEIMMNKKIMKEDNVKDKFHHIVSEICEFSPNGPDFFEYAIPKFSKEELSEFDQKMLIRLRSENRKLQSKQHSKTAINRLTKSINTKNLKIVGNLSHLSKARLNELKVFIDSYHNHPEEKEHDDEVVKDYADIIKPKSKQKKK